MFEWAVSTGGSYVSTIGAVWKVVEHFGGGALLEEMGNWRPALGFHSLFPFPVWPRFKEPSCVLLPLCDCLLPWDFPPWWLCHLTLGTKMDSSCLSCQLYGHSNHNNESKWYSAMLLSVELVFSNTSQSWFFTGRWKLLPSLCVVRPARPIHTCCRHQFPIHSSIVRNLGSSHTFHRSLILCR